MDGLVYTLATPSNIASAIGCVQVRSSDPETMDALVRAHGLITPPGRPGLRDLFGADEGLVIRWDATTLDLFPHAGPAIMRRLVRALEAVGIAPAQGYAYPEASDDIEQRMLGALASAPSPLAIDLLLDQPRRWRAHTKGNPLADHASLSHLLKPPLIAAVGAPNIGKSTLLNALAGRSVAIVADEPGTTRDHVGAMLDLGGLVVRYLDTPGQWEDAEGTDRAAIELANRALETADLILACGDPRTPPITPVEGEMLRVCLRADLGEPSWTPDLSVCAPDGTGLTDLATAVRDRLVPPSALAAPFPWAFWGAHEGAI